MYNSISIQQVSSSQIDLLRSLSHRTFMESFAAQNTEENMKKHLEEVLSEENLLRELNRPETFFYFAVVNDRPIGFIQLNQGDSQTELKDPTALEIQRIYVLEEFQGKKVGQLLYQHALSIAKEHQLAFIWLGVWEKNDRAIAFYTKNGFVPFDEHIFRVGDDDQVDILMKKML